jgi:hypothetical protein
MAIVCGSSAVVFVDSSAVEIHCDLPRKKPLGNITLGVRSTLCFRNCTRSVCVSGYVSRTEKQALFVCVAGVSNVLVLRLRYSVLNYNKYPNFSFITENLGVNIFGCVVCF